MARSALYMVNTATQNLEIGNLLNLGTIQRRYGPNLNGNGTNITVVGSGFYEINASITCNAVNTDIITISLYKDNVAIPGAAASVTPSAAGDTVNLSIVGMIREKCDCCDGESLSTITAILSNAPADITNVAITVEKL